MAALIAGAALIIGTANKSFQQRQANSNVKGFFQSNPHIVSRSELDRLTAEVLTPDEGPYSFRLFHWTVWLARPCFAESHLNNQACGIGPPRWLLAQVFADDVARLSNGRIPREAVRPDHFRNIV